MATSSITHNFVVHDPEKFIHAFEESERAVANLTTRKTVDAQFVSDPKEIKKFFAKRK